MLLLTDLWIEFFINKFSQKENLEIMRTIVKITGGDDIIIYNNQAKLLGMPPIDCDLKSSDL